MATFSHPAYGYENISIKEYLTLATKIENPVDLMRLPKGKTFQVNTDHYVLQFFFSGQNLLGIIFKRDLSQPIHLRWCFFRNCEESPFDYKVVIANPHQPPFKENFFEVKFPAFKNVTSHAKEAKSSFGILNLDDPGPLSPFPCIT